MWWLASLDHFDETLARGRSAPQRQLNFTQGAHGAAMCALRLGPAPSSDHKLHEASSKAIWRSGVTR